MNVASFMTRDPLTIGPDTTASQALGTMDEHGVRHLPVVDQGRLVGVISDRDVLDANGTVGDVMRRRVVTVRPVDTALTIATDFAAEGIGCLPVVDSDALVGIVTEFDLLRLFVEACRTHRMSRSVDPLIGRTMTRTVVALQATDSLQDAEAALATIGVRHAPVVSDSELVGILSDRDVRRARGRGLAPKTAVEEFMTRQVATLSPEHAVSAAAEIMADHRFNAVPVLDGGLTGILCSSDVVEHCIRALRSPEWAGSDCMPRAPIPYPFDPPVRRA